MKNEIVIHNETDLQSKIYTIRGTEQLHELIFRFLHDSADIGSLNVETFSFYAESVFYSEKVGAKLFHVIVSVIVFGDKAAGCSDVDQSLCFAQPFRDSRFIIDKSPWDDGVGGLSIPRLVLFQDDALARLLSGAEHDFAVGGEVRDRDQAFRVADALFADMASAA